MYTPDGRAWRIVRAPRGQALSTRLLRREGWRVRATTAGPPEERREWHVASRADASSLVDEIALALRTGAEGPPEPAPTDTPA
ncbi:MAG: hypothetical protein KY461_03145 [Actinobacteria bacterium]|nr:hypothetical protein [Actinomycetota bacterium]